MLFRLYFRHDRIDVSVVCKNEGGATRTPDLRIKSPLLYQLSYALGRRHSADGAVAAWMDDVVADHIFKTGGGRLRSFRQ